MKVSDKKKNGSERKLCCAVSMDDVWIGMSETELLLAMHLVGRINLE